MMRHGDGTNLDFDAESGTKLSFGWISVEAAMLNALRYN